MMDITWIKIYRKIMDNSMFHDSKTLHVFLFLLLKANVKPSEWCGKSIQRGQLVTSYNSIAEYTGMSVSSARRAIKNLIVSGEITTEPTNRYNVITIVKYNDYQDKYVDFEQSGEQSGEHQIKNNKNDKNIKNKGERSQRTARARNTTNAKKPMAETEPPAKIRKVWERTRKVPEQYLFRFETEEDWDRYVEQHREEVEKAYGL